MFDQEYDKATRGDGAESLFDSRKAELDAQARVGLNQYWAPGQLFKSNDMWQCHIQQSTFDIKVSSMRVSTPL